MKIACLEHLLPGGRLHEKWDFAARAGYNAIELRGLGAYAFRQRLPELRRAVRDGVVLQMVSVEMRHYFGAFDRELRRDAIIEEDEPAAALRSAGRLVGHVDVGDSNGFQPGAGHLDWSSVRTALSSSGYDGFLTVKCRLRGDEVAAVAGVPAFLRAR